jgi:hypothetical protein
MLHEAVPYIGRGSEPDTRTKHRRAGQLVRRLRKLGYHAGPRAINPSLADGRDGPVLGYCLERICAGFPAGRAKDSPPEEILMLMHRLVSLPPPEYQGQIAHHLGPGEAARYERTGRR